MENKYKNGKIYQIVDIGYNKCYIGSTTETLSKRMSKHREGYKLNKQGKQTYTTCYTIFDEFSIENCEIKLIELFPCNSKMELEAREGYHIKNTDCVNKHIMGRTQKEWQQDNQERIRAERKIYRENNSDKIKEYYQLNKEVINERNRGYRQLHKERIAEWMKTKFICECGGKCNQNDKSRHFRSQKHLNFIEQTKLKCND